ncbi:MULTISPECIES: zinc ribbon domain-containing protein [Bacillus]|nr:MULTISPECIES: zinc ribbon domain-containing protein [Bacillus]
MPFSKNRKKCGKEKAGTKSVRYCSHCYTNEEFVYQT